MSADIQAVTMPKWGLAMEEGMVVAWHVEPGAEVKAGDDLADIETTKITNVFESPAGGILRRRVVEAGETVPVGALLGVVAEAGAGEGEIDAFIARFNEAFEVRAKEAAETAPEPQTLEVGGLPISYLRVGTGEGTPIVLVHGFGGDLNNWLFNLPALAESHSVYALDLPGHGRSGKAVSGAGLDDLAETLGGFLAAAGLEAAHLAGHSLGGAIALQLALAAPARAASLTLIAPAGLGPEINADYIEGFIAAERRKEMKGVLQMLFADPALVSRDMINDVLKYKRLDGVSAALRAIADAVFPGGRQAGALAPRLAELAVPAQVVWGEADRVVPVSHAEALPETLRVHRFEAVGHMAHMEAAGEVNRLILEMAGPA